MAYTLKEGQGSIFKNKKKEKDTHPDMTGSIKIDGVEYWLSGWAKGEGAGKWLSLQAKPKTEQYKGWIRKDAGKHIEDDIPF
jgi:hypothetical protein